MDILSIVFILFLIGMVIFGLCKGLLYTLFHFGKTIVSIIVGIFLAKPLGSFFYNSFLGNKLNTFLNNLILSKSDTLNQTINTATDEIISAGLTELKIPTFLHGTITEIIKQHFNTDVVNLASSIANALTLFILIIVAFLLITIISSLILLIFRNISKKVNNIPIIGIINRIGGVFAGICIGFVILSCVCMFFSLIISVPGEASMTISSLLNLDSETTSFAKWVYEYNLIAKLLDVFI